MNSKLDKIVLAFALVATLLALGCDDALVEPQTVAELRVLGARLEAITQPERAALMPGEIGRLRLLVVAPESADFGVSYRVCRARERSNEAPACASDETLSEGEATGEANRETQLELSLDSSLEAGQPWLVEFVVCPGAPPASVSNGLICPDGGRPLRALYRSRAVQSTEAANHNPVLDSAELRFGQALWSDSPLDDDCPAELPRLASGETAELRITLGQDPRERLDQEAASGQLPAAGALDAAGYGAPPGEALLLTHVTTLPGLSRPYSSVGAQEPLEPIELEFAADEAAQQPRRAEFFLVARDERGGVSFLRRSFCVVPP